MAKVFEELFIDLQADMVWACMDYSQGDADKIFVYVSQEGSVTTGNCFFERNDRILERHEMDPILGYSDDDEIDHQKVCIMTLMENMDKIAELCEEHQRPMPTEIKMVYDVKKNSLIADYKYDNQWHEHPTKLPHHIVKEWIEEIKNSKLK